MTDDLVESRNEGERRRWNQGYWASSWPKREPLTDAVTDLVLAHAALTDGDRVLDVGSGGGRLSLAASRIVGARGRVVGVDISAPLTRLATDRARATNTTNLGFVVADAQTDSIDGAPFSVAVSQFGVMFFDDPGAAFANLFRQLEAEGRFVFASWQSADRNLWHLSHAMGSYLPPAHQQPVGASTPGLFSLADAERTSELLREAGWSDVAHSNYERRVKVRREAIFDDGQLAFMGVPEDKLGAATAAAERHLANFETDDGQYLVPLGFRIFSCRAAPRS